MSAPHLPDDHDAPDLSKREFRFLNELSVNGKLHDLGAVTICKKKGLIAVDFDGDGGFLPRITEKGRRALLAATNLKKQAGQ